MGLKRAAFRLGVFGAVVGAVGYAAFSGTVVVGAILTGNSSKPRASLTTASRVSFVVLPEAEARKVLATRPFALGLGAYPSSRDPIRFLLEIGRGAPATDDQVYENRLTQALRSSGTFVIGNLSSGPSDIAEAIATAFDPQPLGTPGIPGANELIVQTMDSAASLGALFQSGVDGAIVLGIGERTPILIGIAGGQTPGVLTGSITRRPGVVTPYDVTATLLDLLGAGVPEGVAGNSLDTESDPSARSHLESLKRRLERDDSYAPGLAAVTVTLGVVSIIIALLLKRLRRREVAARIARAAVFVLPGWVVALFVPAGRWEVRGAVVVVAWLLGALLPSKSDVRTMARIGFAGAIVFGVLVAVAPLNPGGEPGLSIWGNPLVSWRFFGVQNVPAAILASGVVVWGVLAGLRPAALAVVAAVGGLVIGAPEIGANFVGVLTFLFGATMAVTALVRRRAELWQVALSGAVAVGGFVLALLADAGSPVSHGGRAARRISSGGWSAAWDIVEGRLRLNARLIREFTGGPLWVAMLVVTLAALIVWGMRVERGPLPGRVAVLGGALMAIASLVLEDSGFYSGAVLWFVAADAWLLVTLLDLSPRESVAPNAGAG